MDTKQINKRIVNGDIVGAMSELKFLVSSNCLPPQEYPLAARTIRKYNRPETPVRIKILGQCTTTWLSECIHVIAWASGVNVELSDGDYDSIIQEMFNLQAGHIDLVVFVPWISKLQSMLGSENHLKEIKDFWKNCWKILEEKQIPFIQIGYDYVGPGATGYFQVSKGVGAIPAIRRLNEILREGMPSSAYYIDLETVSGTIGRNSFYDSRRYYWTKQPFSDEGCICLAHHVVKTIEVATIGPKKVLVLDLDNTIWGGIVAEEGSQGIQLGESPEGEAFREFQRYCKNLSERGVLLAVASKNNIGDARAPFDENKSMCLSYDDIVSFKADWYPKSQMLREIAAEINIGLDSLVFFDDNPVERQEVKTALPQVAVVDVPEDPSQFVKLMEESLLFETYSITTEDVQRKERYAQQKSRNIVAKHFSDIGSYLESLEMTSITNRIDESNFSRCHQLIGKTNQFNVSTRRHSEIKLKSLVETVGSFTWCISLADKFGDYGIISVLIAIPAYDDTLIIDTFLMSCRVINRTVEHQIINCLIDSARKAGYSRILMDYIPTTKNILLQEVIPKLGFMVYAHENNKTTYAIDITKYSCLKSYVNTTYS